jgi:hypothetical protein
MNNNFNFGKEAPLVCEAHASGRDSDPFDRWIPLNRDGWEARYEGHEKDVPQFLKAVRGLKQ